MGEGGRISVKTRMSLLRGLSLSTVALLAGAVPTATAAGDPTLIKFTCSGTFGAGDPGECVRTFRSSESVYVDAHSMFARLTSVAALGWNVEGLISDGRDNPYFAWSCAVDASTVVPVTGWAALLLSSCRASEFLSPEGHSPPRPGTHTIRVTATADFCAEAALGLCPFTASIKLRPGALD